MYKAANEMVKCSLFLPLFSPFIHSLSKHGPITNGSLETFYVGNSELCYVKKSTCSPTINLAHRKKSSCKMCTSETIEKDAWLEMCVKGFLSAIKSGALAPATLP